MIKSALICVICGFWFLELSFGGLKFAGRNSDLTSTSSHPTGIEANGTAMLPLVVHAPGWHCAPNQLRE